MKIRYEFTNGEISEIEVDESLGELLVELDRQEYNNDHMIANVLEYGKSGQPPKPFLKPAKSASRAPCIEAMKQALEQEVEKL